ncbi:condensation domain-containing protein, partial [Nonomuraea guangzhouensis]
ALITLHHDRLIAYLVPADQDSGIPASTELRDHLRATLPDHMIPTTYIALAAFPRTPNGKIDRRALPAPDTTRLDLAGSYQAPSTPTEQLLATIWTDLLGLDRVGTTDNFFNLGGHSLLATQAISRIRATFSVDLSLATLFDQPTIAGLATIVDNTTAAEQAAPPIVAVSRDQRLPLSFAQQRLWFLDQLNPGSVEYNIATPIQLPEQLDIPALHAALATLTERHEVLRTRLVADAEGVPWQVIDLPTGFHLPVVDLTAHDDRDQAVRAWIAKDSATAFDLASGPLIRGSLLRLGDDEHLLALCMHHIVSDEWSAKIFQHELESLYASYRAGQSDPLPPLTVQYADFAAWQRDWLTGPVLDKQLGYWRAQLADTPVLDLPTDRPRPAVRSTAGAAIGFQLNVEITRRLQEVSRQNASTMFMTLLSAYAVLLSKYTGQDDLIVGTPVANRNHGETEQLIGFFVNTLALRADLRGDPTFAELLSQIRGTALAAYTHQDLPFEQLIDELAVVRDRSRTPLVQTLFNYTTNDSATATSAEVLPAKFDLSLTMGSTADGALAGSIQYSTALFDEATIRRMIGHLTELLSAITTNADQHLSALPILTPDEHQQLAVDWNAATAELPQANGIHELITGQPDAPAVIYDDTTLTYGQLETRANQLAHHLLGLGLQREGVVGLCLPRSTHMIVAILAIWKAGGTYLPLDPDYPTDRLTYMLTDSGADLLITTTAEHTAEHAAEPTKYTAELLSGIPAVSLDDPATNAALDAHPTTPPDLSHTLALDDPATQAALNAQPTTPPDVTVLPDQAAYLIYTSGSTG